MSVFCPFHPQISEETTIEMRNEDVIDCMENLYDVICIKVGNVELTSCLQCAGTYL